MNSFKLLLCTLFLLTRLNAFSAFSSSINAALPETTTKDSKLSFQEELKLAQMKWLANLSAADYEKYRGKKLGLVGKMAFKLNQRKVKKKLQRYDYGDEPNTLSKISWFVKGLILGPIAVALAYIFLPGETELINGHGLVLRGLQ